MRLLPNTEISTQVLDFGALLPQLTTTRIRSLLPEQGVKVAFPIGLHDYIQKQDIEKKMVQAPDAQQDFVSKVYPERYQAFIPKTTYTFPEIYYASIEDVYVSSNSALLYKDDYVITHDLLDLRQETIGEEYGKYPFTVSQNAEQLELHYLEFGLAEVEIETAIILSEHLAFNYAHCLTEVLPKLFLIQQQSELNEVPIIVNNDLHANLWYAIACLLKESRLFYIVQPKTRVKVHKAYMFTSVGYMPCESRVNLRPEDTRWVGFFSSVLKQSYLNQQLIPNQYINYLKNKYRNHEKIYVRRNSKVRNILNVQEIETYIQDRGFQIVKPEKLNFLEQMYLFRNARVIVGATGAAFGNLVFSQAGCKVYLLTSEQTLHAMNYWQNISTAVGNGIDIDCIIGESIVSENEVGAIADKIHRNYVIDLQHLDIIGEQS